MLQGLQRPGIVFTWGFGRQILGRYTAFWAVQSFTLWGLTGFWWSVFSLNWLAALALFAYTARCIRSADHD